MASSAGAEAIRHDEVPASKLLTWNGSLEGTVVSQATRSPVRGAIVVLSPGGATDTTDALGRFKFDDLDPDTYVLSVRAIGFQPVLRTDIVVATGRVQQITVDLVPLPIRLDAVAAVPSAFVLDPTRPVSNLQLSNEELRRTPGGQEDVIRAAAVAPGVGQTTGGRNDLIVRGGGPGENLYLVDGIEVSNINHFGTQGATGGPLSYINLDFVESVDFSTGGFGVRYGDRMSSVMDIDIAEGGGDRWGRKLTLSATQFAANARGPLGDHSSVILSARRSYLDFIFKAADFGFVPEYWDFMVKTNTTLGSNDRIRFLAIGALDDIRFFNDTPDQRFDNSRILGNEQEQYLSGIAWEHTAETFSVTTALNRTYATYSYVQRDSLLRQVFGSDSKEGETTLRVDASWSTPSGVDFNTGVSARSARVDGFLRFPGFFTTFGDSLGPVDQSWDERYSKLGLYAETGIWVTPRLRAVGGLRADWFEPIESAWALSPRISLLARLDSRTELSLAVGRYHQAPAYVWVSVNDFNRSLNHLRSDQSVLGLQRRIGETARLRIEFYYKDYSRYPVSTSRQYLVLANAGAGFGGIDQGFDSFGTDDLVSQGEGVARGVDLLVEKRLVGSPFYGRAGVSIGEARFTALDGVERPGLYEQRFLANLGGGYRPNERWEFAFKFRLGDGRPATPFLGDGTQDPADYNSIRLPLFHSLDVRADRRWDFRSWSLVAYLDLQNVYNRKNFNEIRWDPRLMMVEEVGGSIGILPTIGITADF